MKFVEGKAIEKTVTITICSVCEDELESIECFGCGKGFTVNDEVYCCFDRLEHYCKKCKEMRD